MARKTLLTEAEIRSFMKLANLGPIGDARLNEWTPSIEEEEIPNPEEEEDEMADMDAAAPADMEMGADVDAVDDMDAAMDDMDADMGDMDAELGDMDAGMEMGGDKEDQFMDLVQQLADLVGVDVEMDDGPAAPEADMEMGGMDDDVDSLEGGEDLGDEAALDATDDMGDMDDDGEEEPGMKYMEGNTDDVVNEVARRVAARLQSESKKSKMVDQLAERIFKRITSK